ncbi:MAG: indolepyruvate oxidoreductase subunit beta [Thermoprotei archaeon]
MPRYNIFIAGVGGQGLLTLGRILGNAAIEAGHDVTVAEVHGLAQRGGTLNVQVRIGPGEAPQIPIGGADLFIALEALECIRYIKYANENTRIVMNKFVWPPPLAKYPSLDSIIDTLRSKGLKIYLVDANDISKKILGTIISANIAILGFSYAVDEGLQKLLEYEHLEKGLERVFRGKVLELNKKVLKTGYEEGLKSL